MDQWLGEDPNDVGAERAVRGSKPRGVWIFRKDKVPERQAE